MTGSYYNQTVLHPLGLIAVVVLGIATLLLPRRYALAPILVMACFVSPAQRLVIASLDFNLVRLLVLFGWARVLATGEGRGFRWKTLDTAVIAWTLSATVFTALREATIPAIINKLGLNYDVIGLYFLFRVMIRDWKDVEVLARITALISLPVAAAFLFEQSTGRNVFSIFGGVDRVTQMREGRIRCRGPFAHPIYAGCFWAAFAPLIASLWWGRRGWRWLAPAGLAATMIVIVTTASSTPIAGFGAAMLACGLYPARRHLRLIRWGSVLGLTAIHFAMAPPIWHLMARVSFAGGSTGWYRYKMIDGFVRNVEDWWLVGTRSYGKLYSDWYSAITNHYVLEGLEGGLLTLLLFIATITLAFRGVGRAARAVPQRHRFQRMLTWAIGATIFVHAVDFLAVSYFGQVLMTWYLALAICGSLTPAPAEMRRRVHRVRRVDGPSTPTLGSHPFGHPA